MTGSSSSYQRAFGLLTLLFFMWGFITVTNDILINTFKSIFDLNAFHQSFIQLFFFGAFFIVSVIYFLISSRTGQDPLNRIGYKNGMAYSLLICGVGCLAFYPAAQLNSYPAFLIALFILATGVTCLQICANPYATILGDPNSASSRLNLAQGLNSLGTTLGPIVGTILIYKVFSSGVQTADSVAKAYLIYGLVFLILAVFVRTSKMPAFHNTETIESGFGVLKHRQLKLGILAIFFYVGAEVSVGSWIVRFISSKQIMGFEEAEASYYLSYFWGGLMIGRLMGSLSLSEKYSHQQKLLLMPLIGLGALAVVYLMTGVNFNNGQFTLELMDFSNMVIYLGFLAINYIGFIIGKGHPAKTLVLFSSANAILLLLAIFTDQDLAFWAILATGLFFSIGWSNIFSLAIRDLGQYTSQGASLLVMAIAGGAVLPIIQSLIIDGYGVQVSFIIPLIAVLYLIFYGIEGHKSKVQ